MSEISNKKSNRSLTWLLVKNRLLAQTGLNVLRYEKDPKIKRKKIIMMVSLILLGLMCMGYLTSMAVGYGIMGLNDLTPGIALIISGMFSLFFTVFKANGELFAFNDYDTVMSLPVSTRAIVNSRFINMYLWNTLITIIIMLPMGLVYGWFAQPNWYFYPLWLLGMLLSSLIPTTIAVMIGALITAISIKFRYANVVSTVLSFVLIVGILIGSMSLGSTTSPLANLFDSTGNVKLEALSELAPTISESLEKVYPPVVLFTAGVVEGQVGKFLLFAGLSVGVYLLVISLLALRYRQINTALTTTTSRANYQLGVLHQGSIVAALYKKTLLRILKSTVVATNLLIGCVMAIIAAGALLVVGPEKLAGMMELPSVLPIIKSAAPFAIAAMASMTNTACVSLALEGKSIWVIKSLPIPPKSLYDSYLLVNLSFTVPTVLICATLSSLALKTTVIETIILFVTPLIFVTTTAVIGLLIGNRMAYYDWQEETQLIKQSLMSMLGMLGGVIVIGIAGVVVASGILPLEAGYLTIAVSLVVTILTAILYLKESQRPIKE